MKKLSWQTIALGVTMFSWGVTVGIFSVTFVPRSKYEADMAAKDEKIYALEHKIDDNYMDHEKKIWQNSVANDGLATAALSDTE
jgi:hypothetical protein